MLTFELGAQGVHPPRPHLLHVVDKEHESLKQGNVEDCDKNPGGWGQLPVPASSVAHPPPPTIAANAKLTIANEGNAHGQDAANNEDDPRDRSDKHDEASLVERKEGNDGTRGAAAVARDQQTIPRRSRVRQRGSAPTH